jgi:hypothetical protein
MAKTKFVYIAIQERNGEREYTHKLVREIPAKADEWEWADKNIAASFYGGAVEEEDDGYYFDAGQVCTSVLETKVVTEDEFKVLQRYL